MKVFLFLMLFISCFSCEFEKDIRKIKFMDKPDALEAVYFNRTFSRQDFYRLNFFISTQNRKSYQNDSYEEILKRANEFAERCSERLSPIIENGCLCSELEMQVFDSSFLFKCLFENKCSKEVKISRIKIDVIDPLNFIILTLYTDPITLSINSSSSTSYEIKRDMDEVNTVLRSHGIFFDEYVKDDEVWDFFRFRIKVMTSTL